MKRLFMTKGDPSLSKRSTSIVVAGATVVGLLLVLGLGQALNASGAGRSLGRASGPKYTRGLAADRGIGFLPRRHRWHRPRKGFGFLGRKCETGKYCPTPPLLYLGGAGVQAKPTLHLILWGSNWSTAEPGSKVRGALAKLYESLSGSSYQGILTQYFDTKGRVGTKVTLSTYIDTKVTAPTEVNDAKIQTEVSDAIAATLWKREFDAQFIVVPAPHSTYEASFGPGFSGNIDFCAYHGVTGAEESSYSFVPYMGDAPFSKGCRNEGTTKEAETATTGSASHEYAESATNPNPKVVAGKATWLTSDGYEITDICAKDTDLLFGGVGVQGQWDNFQGDCSLADASPAFVYSVTESATAVTENTATLNGTVNPESMITEYFFEYGPTTKYGSKTTIGKAGEGRSNVKEKAAITGLAFKSLFHYRLVAKNSTGTGNGLDQATKTL